MSTMTLIQRNGSAEGVNPWLKTTVQQFFQGMNWENRSQPPSAPSLPPSASPPMPADSGPPDLALKVNQFFDAIAWDGTPAIAAPPPVEEAAAPPAEKTVTLDDFFGSF
jgi:hypothetical protein